MLHMKIIKLDAIPSTNALLREKSTKEKLDDYTIVMARKQTAGRGQMGTSWESEEGKNITISVFKKISCLRNHEQFYISMAVSLSLLQAIRGFYLPKLSIKWPNDILSDSEKIGGILIENVIRKRSLDAAIIGIGLNVNQITFKGLPSASSLKKIMGIHFSLDEVLARILSNLTAYATRLEERDFEGLHQEYHHHLFRKDKPSTFKGLDNQIFMGFIKGVSPQGKLKVLMEDEVLKEFGLKELKLLY